MKRIFLAALAARPGWTAAAAISADLLDRQRPDAMLNHTSDRVAQR